MSKPHRVYTFKLSTDSAFVTRMRDVVGLYRHPPERAGVFAFDEKSQIQALDRTQPGLPMQKGRAGATGSLLQDCMPHHRHQALLAFMRRLERSVASDSAIHVIPEESYDVMRIVW